MSTLARLHGSCVGYLGIVAYWTTCNARGMQRLLLLMAFALSRFRIMWTAATSGTSNASRHHIQEGVHLSKVPLKFVGPFVGNSFVLKYRVLSSVANCERPLLVRN